MLYLYSILSIVIMGTSLLAIDKNPDNSGDQKISIQYPMQPTYSEGQKISTQYPMQPTYSEGQKNPISYHMQGVSHSAKSHSDGRTEYIYKYPDGSKLTNTHYSANSKK